MAEKNQAEKDYVMISSLYGLIKNVSISEITLIIRHKLRVNHGHVRCISDAWTMMMDGLQINRPPSVTIAD